jgi:hypothetical protein
MINQSRTSVAIFGVLAAVIVGTLMSTQSASAALQSNGASLFAPGHGAVVPGSLENAADKPVHEDEGQQQHGKLPGGGCIASFASPGHLFIQEPTITDINP